MIRPDDETKPFVGRWNSLIRILLVESSVKLVARAAMDYADLYDGTSCHPSNERLARETGYSKRTVITAWAVIRGLGLADRVGHGVPHKHKADEYELLIPDAWVSMPTLGPRAGKFTCLHCGKLFNPPGHSKLRHDGTVGFDPRLFAFCPAPRQRKGRDEPWCFEEWDAERAARRDQVWGQMANAEVWKLFRESRGDDW